MLNVGPLELLVVLAVALIVVGPERLPELARSVGRALRQFREVQDEVRDMVSSSVDDDMREVASEFKKAAGGVKRATDVKGAVRRTERSIREQTTPSGASRTTKSTPGREAEPGGPPAERLVEDASDPATPSSRPGREATQRPSPNGEQGPEDRSTP
jgi:sec-independent protein translocase protein TatB